MTEKSLLKPFEPMLAAPRGEAKFPVIVQAKYDGIRCVIRNGVALTRKLEPIPNELISSTLSNELYDGLDGELICGSPTDKDVYHITESCVMSEMGDTSGVVFYVFDDFTDPRLPYFERFTRAARRTEGENSDIIQPALWGTARNEEELAQIDDWMHSEGYEGSIVRDPQGLYKHGRATENEGTLFKMKRFVDDEMLVVVVEERFHNANEDVRSNTNKSKRGKSKEGMIPTGMLGCLVGISPKWPGEELRVGSSNLPKITLAEAKAMFVGNYITFKHQPAGAKDKPRFPVYKGIRHRSDMS